MAIQVIKPQLIPTLLILWSTEEAGPVLQLPKSSPPKVPPHQRSILELVSMEEDSP
jgi:hypothetical protein